MKNQKLRIDKTEINFKGKKYEISFDNFTIKGVEHLDIIKAIDLESGEIMNADFIDIHNFDLAIEIEKFLDKEINQKF